VTVMHAGILSEKEQRYSIHYLWHFSKKCRKASLTKRPLVLRVAVSKKKLVSYSGLYGTLPIMLTNLSYMT
jgi:hypothetical protein